MNPEPAILVQDLGFAYDGSPVLDSVSFSVAAGEAVAIVGPNGGGKTTLLKVLLGLLPAQRGTVRLFGRTPAEARSRIGYTPQHQPFDPLFPVTALEVVAMGRVGPGTWIRPPAADLAAARACLAEVDLADAADRLYPSLSGGQRQRVLIARALCTDPDLLLLDEPTAMVDQSSETRLLRKLQELHRRLTLVIVTHDLGFVSDLVQKVICLNRRAEMHEARRLRPEMLEEMYGERLRLVHHHGHDHSHCPADD